MSIVPTLQNLSNSKKVGESQNISNVQAKPNFEPQPTYPFPVDCQREQYSQFIRPPKSLVKHQTCPELSMLVPVIDNEFRF